ncbi:MAG: SDR family oxidoreductase [Candidatus Omnitrophota bacterium]|nr:SDR family oxidoreductase [Candidatus Omnitrophota bacterium]MDZ4243213.1 SDR family oxidoreductase [Candidatus Omnitrophota bacterium]
MTINKTDGVVELKYSEEEVQACVEMLESLVKNSEQLAYLPQEMKIALLAASGKLSRPDRIELRKRRRDMRRVKHSRVENLERKARASTGIRSARQAAVFTAPLRISTDSPDFRHEPAELQTPRNCYVCKDEFTKLHFFYDAMCPKCADFNYQKRFQTAPLHGRVALITGSRLKIGYQATLMMLRAGARVIATTRFPVDSALRYAKEKDFGEWGGRLHIYGLDLRHTPSVELFCNYFEQTYDRLDILINNAAQTVRRPPGFYAHLMASENRSYEDLPEDVQKLLRPFEECKKRLMSHVRPQIAGEAILPAVSWDGKSPGIGLRASAQLSQVPYSYDHTLAPEKVFPVGKLDADLQQVDLRATNSWRLRLGEVPTAELFEIQLVNAIAPFVMCNKLSTVMKRDNTGQKHIVNVSAMEGKFQRYIKTDRHPHTNMAKAALNMLTHTSASDLADYGIFMNSVDTGWVTDEDPAALSARKQEVHDFQPPLDIVDGAARVCDPFFSGILTGEHWSGRFLKDYFPISW